MSRGVNLETIAGVHYSGRQILKLLGTPNDNINQLAQQLKNVGSDPIKLAALSGALFAFESHIRALGALELVPAA